MKKPVAEVNIKVFSVGSHFKSNTTVKINSDNPNAVIAILEALEFSRKKIAEKEYKKATKRLIKELESTLEDK